MSERARRDDGGAVAVITALVAVALFAVAALAVDLAHAYARQVAVQSVADVAARDAAAALPSACDAVLVGAQALAAPANRVPDATGAPPPMLPADLTAVASSLLDNDLGNGEVTAYGPDSNGNGLLDEAPVRLTSCPRFATRVRVVAPPRPVRFSFGAVVEREQVTVSATAAAGIVSALPLLPLAIPSTCAAAQSHTLVVRQPGLSVAVPTPVEPSGPALVGVSRLAAQLTLTVRESPVRPGPAGYSVRFRADSGEYFAAANAVDAVAGVRTVAVTIPGEVMQRPGAWAVSVSGSPLTPGGAAPLPPWSGSRGITIATTPIPSCDPSGRYGDLLTISPALPLTPPANNVAAAATDGLAYPLGGRVRVNGQADQNAVADRLSTGLLRRLSRPSAVPCPAGGADLGDWSRPGLTVTANNALSCYFPLSGPTVAPGFIDEPRAFMVAVVDVGQTRPVDTVNVPVTGYVVAYVSDEVPGVPESLVTRPCSSVDLACNGIRLTPSGLLDRLTVYRFDAGALPEAFRVRDNGHPFTAGTRDVLLLR